jgi:hypothetical protein
MIRYSYCIPKKADTEAERKSLLFRRVRQSDGLARFAYRTVLSSEELIQHFRTDSKIAAFWAKEDGERIKLLTIWGHLSKALCAKRPPARGKA